MGKFKQRHHKQRNQKYRQAQSRKTMTKPNGTVSTVVSESNYKGPINEKYDGLPCTPRRNNKPEVGIKGLSKLGKPIVFSRLAYDKQNYFIAHCDKEISWLGLVEETEKEFYVEDVILFQQEVSGAQTEIKEEDIAKFFEELIEEHGEDSALNEFLPKLKFWGHSHVNMGVSPSGTDDTTLKYMFRPEMDFFIRVIANKKGDLKADLYRNFHCAELEEPLGFTWLDTTWDVEHVIEEPVPGLLNEMLNKVRSEAPRVTQHNPYSHMPWTGPRNNEVIGPGVNENKKNFEPPISTPTNTGNSTASDSERPTLKHWEYIWWTHMFSYSHFFERFFNGESTALAGPALLKEDKAA